MKPGFDPLLQAYGGMMSVTGRPEDPPTFCRRLDQRQGDRHVLHHRRAGGASHARQDGQGLPGRHLAVRLGGPLGRGPGQQLHRQRRRPAAPRHRRRGDRALPDLRYGRRQAAVPGAGQRPAVGALRAGAGPSRMGDRSEVRQECGAREVQGRAAADDRPGDAAQITRRLDRGVREGGRALRRGQRHRRARQHAAVRRIGDRAGAAGRRRPRWSACRSPSTTSARARRGRRPSWASIRRRCWAGWRSIGARTSRSAHVLVGTLHERTWRSALRSTF